MIPEQLDSHLNKENTKPKKKEKKTLRPLYIPASPHPLLKWPNSTSGSHLVAITPSALSLRNSAGAIFIRFK